MKHLTILSMLLMPALSIGAELTENDMTYLGAFRVPKSSGTESLMNGGKGLTYNPDNNSLLMYGNILYNGNGANTIEISIPAVVNSTTLSSLNTATVLQSTADISDGNWSNLESDGAETPAEAPGVPGGLLVYNGGLIGTSWAYYDGDGTHSERSHFTADLDWSDGVGFAGLYPVGAPVTSDVANGGYVGKYMALIPSEWQSAFGGTVLTGNSSIPIVGRTSLGPSLWAFDPADFNASGTPATAHVLYPLENPNIGQYEDEMYPLYNRGTPNNAVIFPDGFDSILVFGAIGLGATGNGDSCYGHTTHTESEHNTFSSGQVTTSVTSLSIPSGGSVTFYTQTGLTISTGVAAIAKPNEEPDYHIGGNVTSYNASTGQLDMSVVYDHHVGAGYGPYSAWTIHINSGSDLSDRRCYNLLSAAAEKGGNAYPYAYAIWHYGAQDILDAASPWDVTPDLWRIMMPTPYLSDTVEFAGAAYDPSNSVIYVAQAQADEDSGNYYPLIHAYAIDPDPQTYTILLQDGSFVQGAN